MNPGSVTPTNLFQQKCFEGTIPATTSRHLNEKNWYLKPGCCGLIGSFPFHYYFLLIDLRLICNASVHQNSCWEYCDCFSPSWQRSLFFQTSSCIPVLIWLCLLQWIQQDKAKGSSTSPWLPLTFGCQQAPGSCADGCLWACLHRLGMASKCQEPFSHTRGSPVTSHPSQSLPLPHVQEPPHLIHDYFHVNAAL